MDIYIAFSDPREGDDPILGVYKSESDAYARVGKYNRENNDKNDLPANVDEMTDEQLGQAALNQFSCIIGWVTDKELK